VQIGPVVRVALVSAHDSWVMFTLVVGAAGDTEQEAVVPAEGDEVLFQLFESESMISALS
jgi:hypothetical protein